MQYHHIQDEEGPFEIRCPSCGGNATWRFIDDAKRLGAIDCAQCGSYEMGRSELERVEAEPAPVR